jgi:hypothetical protein
MVLDAALGDVVQEQCDVKEVPVPRLNGPHQLGGEFGILGATGLDIGKRADAAQQMLVHGVVVVHVELHHCDNAAEGGHELAEYPSLVHSPQYGFGIVLRGEDL